MKKQSISINTVVNRPVDQVWEKWTLPQHVMEWNNATEDWYTPSAVINLKVNGRFNYRMSSRDGSSSFDFSGIYDEVIIGKKIAYTLDDSRIVIIEFTDLGGRVKVQETFEAEDTHSLEKQRSGWQAILYNFKRYAENS